MAMGRPQKPYPASWGELIQGLYKCTDGRWRINATGEKFTEVDERIAVKRFREWQAKNQPAPIVSMPIPVESAAAIAPTATIDGKPASIEFAQLWKQMEQGNPNAVSFANLKPAASKIETTLPLPGDAFWLWLRTLLLRLSVQSSAYRPAGSAGGR